MHQLLVMATVHICTCIFLNASQAMKWFTAHNVNHSQSWRLAPFKTPEVSVSLLNSPPPLPAAPTVWSRTLDRLSWNPLSHLRATLTQTATSPSTTISIKKFPLDVRLHLLIFFFFFLPWYYITVTSKYRSSVGKPQSLWRGWLSHYLSIMPVATEQNYFHYSTF